MSHTQATLGTIAHHQHLFERAGWNVGRLRHRVRNVLAHQTVVVRRTRRVHPPDHLGSIAEPAKSSAVNGQVFPAVSATHVAVSWVVGGIISVP